MDRPKGSVQLMRIRNVPVYFHWSFPAGAFIPMGIARFDPVPSLYLCGGYVMIVLMHELGHLLAAHFVRHRVFWIQISAAGGLCRVEPARGPGSAFFIYSGGLIAQLILFLIGVAGFASLPDYPSEAFSFFLIAATFMNGVMLIVNLLPIASGPTDGYVLWQLLKWYAKQRF